MRKRIATVVVAAWLTLVGAACAGDGGVSTSPSAPTPSTAESAVTTPTTPSIEPSEIVPTPTTSPSSAASPSPTLEDGRHFGYIRSIDPSSETLVFDLAYFLTGDEANQAAAEHGDETPVPNDYYIVNDNPLLRTLRLAPDVQIRVIDWGNCCEPVQGELQPFVDAFHTKHHPWNAMYPGGESPYWLTVEDGVIVEIEEQYLP